MNPETPVKSTTHFLTERESTVLLVFLLVVVLGFASLLNLGDIPNPQTNTDKQKTADPAFSSKLNETTLRMSTNGEVISINILPSDNLEDVANRLEKQLTSLGWVTDRDGSQGNKLILRGRKDGKQMALSIIKDNQSTISIQVSNQSNN